MDANGTDVDQTGLAKKNATACFMNLKEEVLKESIILFDNMMMWRVEEYEYADTGATLPGIVIHNGTKLDISFDESTESACSMETESFVPGSGDAVRPVDVPPPMYPKRFVVVFQFVCESENENHVDIKISGNR